jgi:predicted metal-dependent hydrolase
MLNPLPTALRAVKRLATGAAAPSRPARSPSTRTIPVRNLRFDVKDADRPRFWHAAGPAVSVYFDNLSVFFPVGERFFIQSVKAFKDKAPEGTPLADAVRAFYAQEAYHGREHRAYNARLEALGYPIARMEKRVERLLAVVTRVAPPRFQLAATVALEHFTAFMGQQLLQNPALLEGSDPELAALWRWHAVEENEHKAVAFDLFVAAGGTWAERAAAMVLAALIFWFKVVEQQVRMMKAAGLAADPGAWRELYRYLYVSPGNMRRMPGAVLDFLRPSFHPDDVDTQPLIDAWRASQDTGRAAAGEG